ncbi:MAG: decarboxylase family protein [Holophagaceae bacterium]|nr:decarboxylase family protein [Holophagaceae bacterium]
MTLNSLCIYCGSSTGRNPRFMTAAMELGRDLALSGITLVYGGAKVGLMGAVADGALSEGGRVIGVIPQGLVEKEVAHQGLSELQVVDSMHERKARMAELSDGFIALPGGLGTFEELFEVWTWDQLGLHAKPLGLLNVADYYNPLLAFLDHATAEGFVRPRNRDTLIVAGSASELLARMQAAHPKGSLPWLSPDQL